FYTHSFSGTPKIHGVQYVSGPGGSNTPSPIFKYITSASNGGGSYNFTFSELNDDDYLDWTTYDSVGTDYTSYFITGYKIRGQAQRRQQINYVTMFSQSDGGASAYTIQGIWDYGIRSDSGKMSNIELSEASRFGVIPRRIRLR